MNRNSNSSTEEDHMDIEEDEPNPVNGPLIRDMIMPAFHSINQSSVDSIKSVNRIRKP